ncbi:MAG: glycerophosphodiester phosphodiesterase family protein [Acidobacteriota bacterium]
MSTRLVDDALSLLWISWRDFQRAWGRLLETDLFYKLVAFVLLTPLAGLILNLFVARSGSSVVADQDIFWFLIRPVGLICLAVIGGIACAIVVLESGCLMLIGYGELRDCPIGAFAAIRRGLRSSTRVVRLTFHIVVVLMLTAIPFLVVIALLYLQLLTQFDINYYLAERPAEFKLAVVLAALLIAVFAALVIRRLGSWALALPILLFEAETPKRALEQSVERMRGRLPLVSLSLLAWSASALVLSAVPLGLVDLLSEWIFPNVRNSMTAVTAAAGVLLTLFVITQFLVTAISASTLAMLLLRLWEKSAVDPDRLVDLGETRAASTWIRNLKPGAVGIIVATIAALAGVAGFGIFAIDRVRLVDDVSIIAHRGGALHAPENTLAAIEQGIVDGADYIEIDVQEDAEGRVVVLHDSDLRRVGGTGLRIWEATPSELAEIDIGSGFDPRFHDQRVPTLEEVLELCHGRAKVIIELKYYGHNDRLEERVSEIVEGLDMESEIVVMSLKYDMVQEMKSIRPDWTVGLLTAKAIGNLTTLEADFLAVNSGMARMPFVRSAHRAGKEVFVWTMNDALGMSVMMSRGVDGVITDDPALARSVVAWRQELNPAERAMLALAYWFGIDPPTADVKTDVG